MNGKYLLLGSNLGNKTENIKLAISILSRNSIKIVKSSSLYITSPWGNKNQPDFLNQVIKIETILTPDELMDTIHKTENQMGRKRGLKWTSRVIDIDILYYEGQITNSKNLTIPHPLIPDRKFTLMPLVEIAPDEIHPVLKISNRTLLDKTSDSGTVEIFSERSVTIPDYGRKLRE